MNSDLASVIARIRLARHAFGSSGTMNSPEFLMTRLKESELWSANEFLKDHLKSCSEFKGGRESFLEKFSEIDSNLGRVNFILEELKHANFSGRFCPDKKSDLSAEQQKMQGNLHFKQGRYALALDSYSKCIAQAKSEKLLALGYGNRSAALMMLNLFKECVEDIDRAFANNYPQDLRAKLIRRREEALEQTPTQAPEYEEIPKIKKKNPKIQCASNSVEIAHNEQFGRHVIATRNIAIGEVIAVEEPFACVPKARNLTTHCQNCARICYNPIPCPSCTVTLYCNETCREKAFAVYHKYECPVAKSLKKFTELRGSGVFSNQYLPLRFAFYAIEEERKKNNGPAEEDAMYRSDRSVEILKLTSHADKFPIEEMFLSVLLPALVFECLNKNSSLFGEVDKEKFKDVSTTFDSICPQNVNIIHVMAAEENGAFEMDEVSSGIYSFFSLFNHSCCANVMRINYGTTLVLRAIRTIKKGDQCQITYGCQYGPDPIWERQEMLSEQYFFTCSCEACENSWPITESAPASWRFPEKHAYLIKLSEELRTPDVALARKMLPRLLKDFKKHEHLEPYTHNLDLLLVLVMRCYEIFGSKAHLPSTAELED